MHPQISVIVPVYKVEPYIHRCVDSILAQTLTEFELILVDDGSPDNCGKICDEYVQKDNRIKAIHKENGGVSSSRNAGLNIAQGKYIMFVDSDDWIEPDAMKILLYHIIKDDSDVVVYSFINDIYSDKELTKSEMHGVYRKYYFKTQEIGNHFLYFLNSAGMLSSWMYLFKANIIFDGNLKFNTNMVLYEDFNFNLNYLTKCNSISFVPDILYHYTLQTSVNLLAKRNKINIVPDINIVSKSLLDFSAHIKVKDSVFPQIYSYVLSMYTLCLRKIIIHRKSTDFKDIFQVLRQLNNDYIFETVITQYGNTLRFYKLLFSLIKKQLYFPAYFLLLIGLK